VSVKIVEQFGEPHTDKFQFVRTVAEDVVHTTTVRKAMLYRQSFQRTSRSLWEKLFTNVFSLAQLESWKKKLPKFGCSCEAFYRDWEASNLPTFPLSFEWKHALKSAVNEKLEQPTIDLETARHIWRQIAPIKKKRNVDAVSSLSPNKLQRQVQCIESWITSGFNVVLLQTRNEIEAYRHLVPRAKFIEITTERPLIRDMAKHGIIINSDCEMHGAGPSKIELNSFYLRWNYTEGRASREEEWGLDACCVDYRTLPKDFTFQIGKPFWDYAVPAILINKNLPYRINHIPWLHHLKHELNWTQDDWHAGHNWVLQRFTGDYSSPLYRNAMDPSFGYNKQLGMWVKNEKSNSL
jgi:hypothetical protein